jgi:hypothetical protein
VLIKRGEPGTVHKRTIKWLSFFIFKRKKKMIATQIKLFS